MSMQFGSSLLRVSTLLALLFAPACADDDDDSSGTEGATSGDSASSSASASASAGTSNTTNGSGANTTSTSGSTSAATGDSGGGQACNGDWTLGSVPFSGEPMLGQACDGNPPKNCADGTYIMFGTGECVCIALCSSLGVDVGQNCTDSGQWVCANIEATNASMNSAKACVNKDWNLCTMGGSGGGTTSTSGGGTTSTSGGTNSTTSTSGSSDTASCTPNGGGCSFSDECCSNNCEFDLCA